MSNMHKWVSELGNNVFYNFIANILVLAIVPLMALIIAFWSNNPQTVLIIVLIVFAVANTGIGLSHLRQIRLIREDLKKLTTEKEGASRRESRHPLLGQLNQELDLTKRFFDEESRPQALVFEFTNRGGNVMRVHKVTFSGSSLGFSDSSLLPTYRKVAAGVSEIPFDTSKAEIHPGKKFTVRMELSQIWERDQIDSKAAKLGFLTLQVDYMGETLDRLFML